MSSYKQNPDRNEANTSKEFQELSDKPAPSLVQEFWVFMAENKKWWLLPILLTMGLIGLLIFFGSTGAAPFIYTLF